MKKNIALCGMMGTSKSTCGKILASELGMYFLDVDDLIEYEERKTIAKIFEDCGEAGFRQIEAKHIARVSNYENIVMATGGGVVLNDENINNIKKTSYIVLLTADSKTIYKRVKSQKNKRPLLKKMSVKTIETIQQQRKEKYLMCADIVVDTSNLTPEQTVGEIKKQLKNLV